MILTGGTGCSICNFIIGGLGTATPSTTINNAILGMICIWVLFYACCLAGICWGISAELPSPRLRAKTAAFAQNFYQVFGIVFGFVVPLMLASGPGAANWCLPPPASALTQQGCQDAVLIRILRRVWHHTQLLLSPGGELFHPARVTTRSGAEPTARLTKCSRREFPRA